MDLSDNQLCMLEQLTYIDAKLINKVTGKDYSDEQIMELLRGQDCSVRQMLDNLGLTDKAIEKLAQMGDEAVGHVECNEWASILKYIKSSELGDLKLANVSTTDTKVYAFCFTQGEDPSKAVVAFRGTIDDDEWVDNVQGLNVSDTEEQKRALDYIESLPYDSITVTGHSKGANKAMYVAITSDKVDRCVAYDGQGFSQEFIDKYWAEIQVRGGNIKAYSLSTDYVHALLFPIPNAEQIYCQGYGVVNIGQHHSANSFFVTDANGNIILDENGEPMVVQISEDESIEMLHNFTTFVINNAPDADKVVIVDFISQLLKMAFGGDKVDAQEIIDFALNNPDTLALIIAYLAKYMDTYNLDADDINKLLETLGLNHLNSLITLTDFDAFGYHVDVNLNLANILNYIKEQLNDGNDDGILKYLVLPALKAIFAGDYDIDITAFWEKINSKVKDIDTSGGCGDATAREGSVRDFSTSVYEALMNAINRIEALGGGTASSWNNYANEEWYSGLLVGIAIRGINAYFSKLTETNQTCKTKIDTIFDNVKSVDDSISARMITRCQTLQDANTYITSMANNIIG